MVSKILALALGLLIPTALATPAFTNHGTIDGWSSEYIDPNTQGHINQVSNIAASLPGTSLKFEQKYLGAGYTGRYHAEKHYDNGYRRGDHKFYGFSFRLQSDWDYTSQLYNIAQWGSDFSDVKCPNGKAADDYSPSSMVYVNGTQLWTRVKYGQLLPGKPCPPDDRKWDCSIAPDANCQPTTAFKLADNIGRAQWYKLTFEVSWKSDATGMFKVWVDDKVVLDKSNLKTTVLENGHKFDFRVGLYANSWHDEHKLVGTQGFRQVWIDEIGVGSAKEDANPK